MIRRLLVLTEQFWFRPALLTILSVILAELSIRAEETYGAPTNIPFLYSGSPTGARTLLGAVASSMIGVAGTVFSITIAALSLASGQMGPRLLNNFTEDKGNQYTLGVFISTFAFSLYTLRAVQGNDGDNTAFVPHYGVTIALLLAALCLGMLVYYIHHISRSINITTVSALLRDDVRQVLDNYTLEDRTERTGSNPDSEMTRPAPPEAFWEQSWPVYYGEDGGYLQSVERKGLLDLLEQADVALLLEVRPGDYIFPHMPVGRVLPGASLDRLVDTDPHDSRREQRETLRQQLVAKLIVGQERSKEADPEYAVRQLADIATRALSPGTNDPLTAVGVLDQFGDALCRLRGRHFPSGVFYQEPDDRQEQGQRAAGQQGNGRPEGGAPGAALRLVASTTSFSGLSDQMFHMIRQYGADAPAVVLRMLEVLTQAVQVLERPDWREDLSRHAQLIHSDALEKISNSGDLQDIKNRYQRFLKAVNTPARQSGADSGSAHPPRDEDRTAAAESFPRRQTGADETGMSPAGR